jgi:hypothetical protein
MNATVWMCPTPGCGNYFASSTAGDLTQAWNLDQYGKRTFLRSRCPDCFNRSTSGCGCTPRHRRRRHDRDPRSPGVPVLGRPGLAGELMPRQAQRPVEPVKRVLLTKQEAATSMGMSVDTFHARVQPFINVVMVGQLVMIPPDELERWVRANARRLVPQPS